jgi:transposase
MKAFVRGGEGSWDSVARRPETESAQSDRDHPEPFQSSPAATPAVLPVDKAPLRGAASAGGCRKRRARLRTANRTSATPGPVLKANPKALPCAITEEHAWHQRGPGRCPEGTTGQGGVTTLPLCSNRSATTARPAGNRLGGRVTAVRVGGQFLLRWNPGVADALGVPYPTDVTDGQWRLLEPVLGVGGSRGPKPTLERRRMVNAILYQARTGCQWRYLPSEFGSWNTIWRTFCRWRDRGVWQEAMDVLRRRVRR